MGIVSQLIINSILAGALYALVALGFNLIFATTKFFNLAHGATVVVGGYAAFYFLKILELDLFVSIGGAIVAAGIVGFLFEKLVFLPLRRRKATSMVLLVASLGLLTLVQALIAILFSNQFHTLLPDLSSTKLFSIGGGIVTGSQLIIIAAAIMLGIITFLIIEKTRFGKAVQAVSDDEEVAKIVGIRSDKVIMWVMILGSALAGVAGVATGFETGIQPTMGMPLLLKGVIAAIVGGIGNVYGGIIGAFVLGFVENFGIWKISGEWKDAIAFGLLILFLIFRPGGIIKKK